MDAMELAKAFIDQELSFHEYCAKLEVSDDLKSQAMDLILSRRA